MDWDEDSFECIKDLVGSIIKKLEVYVISSDDVSDEDKNFYTELTLSTIKSAKECKDKQYEKLYRFYIYLSSLTHDMEERFEFLVKNEITMIKDSVIKEVIKELPKNFTKNKTKQQIESEIEAQLSTEESFVPSYSLIIEAITHLYNKLSSEDVIKKLAKNIDDNDFLLKEAEKFFKFKISDFKSFLEFENDSLMIKSITDKGIKKILIKMRILNN